MDNLRLVLLIAGVVLIAGIYLRERHRRRREELEREWYDLPPQAWSDDDQAAAGAAGGSGARPGSVGASDLDAVSGLSARRDDSPVRGLRGAPDQELVVAVTVMAAPGAAIDGAGLVAAFADLELEHGELGIFHRLGAGGEIQFSVANAVRPGTLDPAAMTELSTPGLALFLRVPGPSEPIAACNAMIEVGHALAERCGARLCDDARNPLSTQGANHLREQVVEYLRVHSV